MKMKWGYWYQFFKTGDAVDMEAKKARKHGQNM
jgi:hypothetical protein